MKNRILTGWNVRRIFFLAMGLLITGQAILLSEWVFGLLGLYWVIMGLFGLGCASGYCNVPYQKISQKSQEEAIEVITKSK